MIKPDQKEESQGWLLIVYGGFLATGTLVYLGRIGKLPMLLSVVLAAVIFVPWLGYLLVTFFKKKPKR